MNRPTDNDIQAFWGWFVTVSDSFGQSLENEQLIRELDQKVAMLGDVGWEIGPAPDDIGDNALVITPCGDKERLALTESIVAEAPQCRGWKFYSAKPPKDWHRRLLLEDGSGGEITINANTWRYVLLRFPDSTFDLIVRAPELTEMTDQLASTALETVVQGELGEDKRLKLIETIELVAEFDEELEEKSKSIEVLREHFNHILATHDRRC